MRLRNRLLGLAVLALPQLAPALSTGLAAQDYGDPDLYVRIVPNLWFANVGGLQEFGDVHLAVEDSVLEWAFAGNVHVGKGRWRGIATFSTTSMANPTELTSEGHEGIEVNYDFGLTELMLLASVQVGRFDSAHALSIRGGVRWVEQRQTIVGEVAVGEHKETWLEPVFGAEYYTSMGARLWAAVDGDMGGFGLGSTLTWGMGATLGVSVAKPVDIFMSYRYHHTEYENEDTGYRWEDGTSQGWFFGLNVKL